MRRLKLPKLPKTFPEPLREDEIEKVLTSSISGTYERLRNFAIMMLFLDYLNRERLGPSNPQAEDPGLLLAGDDSQVRQPGSGDLKEKHRRFSPMDNLTFRAKTRGRPRLIP